MFDWLNYDWIIISSYELVLLKKFNWKPMKLVQKSNWIINLLIEIHQSFLSIIIINRIFCFQWKKNVIFFTILSPMCFSIQQQTFQPKKMYSQINYGQPKKRIGKNDRWSRNLSWCIFQPPPPSSTTTNDKQTQLGQTDYEKRKQQQQWVQKNITHSIQ